MKSNFLQGAAVLILAAASLTATGAVAQSSNRVAASTDWSVFVEESPKECWGVSAPKTTVNTKDGKPVQVRRGDILLFVTYRSGKPGEVSFMGGYPFADGSTVEMTVNNGQKFTLFTNGEGAWARSPEEDAKIIAALKSGADVTLTGRSGRGTQTSDKFSLMGFTAAMDEAGSRCK
ncbi:MAG: invasion associated locus B family protein [Sphingomonadales bacterium]|nr:invasion associated locus B family protein [Sphingomonadales bacterium]